MLPTPSYRPLLCLSLVLLHLYPITSRTFIKQWWICFGHQLENVEGQTVYCGIPMLFRITVERSKNNREQFFSILVDEFDYIIVVPEEESSLGDL